MSKSQILQRLYPQKKWSKIYVDKIEETKELESAQRKKNAQGFLDMMSRTVWTRRLLKKIREKLRAKGFSCKKTVENFLPPVEQYPFRIDWGTQVLCIICNLPCLSESIACKSCDTVAHYECILNNIDLDTNEDCLDDDNESGIHVDGEQNFEFYCESCAESRANDVSFYERVSAQLREERVRRIYSRIIAKRVATYIERKRFQKKRKSLSILQNVIRKRIARKKFYAWRRTQMRVVVLELCHIQGLTPDHLVSVSIFDTIKHTQLFRFDKFGDSANNELFLIPGINAHMTIVITICVRRDDGNYTPVSQAVFALRDVVEFLEKKYYSFVLMDKIRWFPQEAKADDVQIVPNGAPSTGGSRKNQSDLRNSSLGSQEISHSAVSKTKDNLSASLSQCNSSSNLHLQNNLGSNACPNGSTITIGYFPQNPISSFCQLAQAPPLDSLRKTVDLSVVRKLGITNNVLTRTTKWWLCLWNLRLYFFQFFGDARPRCVCDIRESHASVIQEKGQLHCVILSFVDGRKWLLEFPSPKDAIKFEFSVTESQRAYKENGGSMFMRSTDIVNSFSWKDFGHDQPTY